MQQDIPIDRIDTTGGTQNSSAGGMASCVESYSKVARALDAYRRGEVIKKLYAATVEPFPIKADR